MDAAGEGDILTMASRAWKFAPKIHRSTFTEDWKRYEYFVATCGVQVKDAITFLPFQLHGELFTPYMSVVGRRVEPFNSLEEVRVTLQAIVGTPDVSCDDFRKRTWKLGEETLDSFMFALQDMAVRLSLPEEMVRSQFLHGLPAEIARDIRIIGDSTMTCAQLVAATNRLHQYKIPEAAVLSGIKDQSDLEKEVERLSVELASLQTSNRKPIVCYSCNKRGHMAKDCRQKSKSRAACFKCGQTGHFQFACPKNC